MMWRLTRARSSSEVLVSRSPSSEVPELAKDVTSSGGRDATASRAAGDCSPVRCDNGRMYFEVDALLNYALDRQQDYQHASPFPHLVIDNFFPESVLTEVVQDFPTESAGTWKRFNDPRHVKLLSKGDSYLAPSIRHLLAQLRTAEFLSFLEVLSGIDGVVADPHNGGCHQTNADGFLDVHVDASWNDRLALYTGINLIIYLNRDWKEDYGGHLELWDADAARCVSRVLPVFNRMVIFSSGDRTYHGHPAPLTCPPGQSRRSLASNYCVSRRPGQQTVFRRSAVYRASPSGIRAMSGRVLASMLIPPIVAEGLRRARARSNARSRSAQRPRD